MRYIITLPFLSFFCHTSINIIYVCVVAVLALAYGSSMDELTFVGMVGLLDPPRDGIQDAVLTLLSTGAHLKMVTGDAEETALAIGNTPARPLDV